MVGGEVGPLHHAGAGRQHGIMLVRSLNYDTRSAKAITASNVGSRSTCELKWPLSGKVWFSLFTPQRGDRMPEILEPAERARAISDMFTLREAFPKLDMPKGMIHQFATPPRNPEECVFALTTRIISADLKTRVTPCQFAGNPDCGSCGCVASMGLAAVAYHKLGGIIPVRALFRASLKIGQRRASRVTVAPVENPLRVLQD